LPDLLKNADFVSFLFSASSKTPANLTSICKLNQEHDGQKSTLVALILKSWNQIIAELKEWHAFAIDIAGSDTPKNDDLSAIACAEMTGEEMSFHPPVIHAPGRPHPTLG
jgi:hypothetical protein